MVGGIRVPNNMPAGERGVDVRKGRDAVAAECAAGPSSATGAVDDRALLNFIVVVVGFGLCRAWIVFCLGAPLVSSGASPTHWIYLASGALCSLVVAGLCRKGGPVLAKVRTALFRITPVALLASGVLIPLAPVLGCELFTIAGFVVGGIGAGPLQVLWGDRFTRHSVQFAAFASPAAAVVTACVAVLSASQASYLGFVVIPLLSFALLLFHASRTGIPWRSALGLGPQAGGEGEAAPADAADGDDAAPLPRPQEGAGDEAAPAERLGVGKLMFSIAVFSMLCRMFDMLSPVNDPLAFLGGSPMLSLVVVGVVFLAIMAKLRSRFNPTFIYRLSLPIMVAGYVAVALLLDAHAAVSILIINIGYEFFDILAWVLFVEVARRREQNALYIFGLGVMFMFAGMALGNGASHIVNSLMVAGNVQANVIAMVAILCLVFIAFLVLPEGTLAQISGSIICRRSERAESVPVSPVSGEEGAAADGQPAPDRLRCQCAAVARDFELTPREGEVLVLLAYGRTLSIIARDLHIAKGTARTHIENIYRKLDVHKQQELIDLVEAHGE